MNTQPARKRFHRILSISFALLCIGITSLATAGREDGTRSAGIPIPGAKQRNPTDVEIRFEFYPTGPYDDSVAPLFMILGQDGRARALRYHLRDQTKNVASYEGMLLQAEVHRLFARVREVFRLPKHRKDYDRRLIYESDGFYLALKQQAGRVKEMSGGLETRPDEVRSLITDMRELWKQLKEVPPGHAYITSRPVEKDRLRRLKHEGPSRLTSIESLRATLQSLLIRS